MILISFKIRRFCRSTVTELRRNKEIRVRWIAFLAVSADCISRNVVADSFLLDPNHLSERWITPKFLPDGSGASRLSAETSPSRDRNNSTPAFYPDSLFAPFSFLSPSLSLPLFPLLSAPELCTLQRVLVPKFRHNVLWILTARRRRHAEGECNLKFELSINDKENRRGWMGAAAGEEEHQWKRNNISFFVSNGLQDEEFGRGITQLASFPSLPHATFPLILALILCLQPPAPVHRVSSISPCSSSHLDGNDNVAR